MPIPPLDAAQRDILRKLPNPFSETVRPQYSDGNFTNWKDWDLAPITIALNTAEYETFDKPTGVLRFYRLIK